MRDRPSGLCLGLVVLPQPGEVVLARAALERCGLVELGPTEGHRIPAVLCCPRGEDRDHLACLQKLPHILRIDIAYAHVITEDPCP